MRPRYRDYDGEVRRLLRLTAEAPAIAAPNKLLIERYARFRYSQGASSAHVLSQVSMLRSLAERFFRSRAFAKFTRADFEKFFADMEMGALVTSRGRRYQPSTMLKYKKLVKYFWRWFDLGEPSFDNPTGYPDAVKWIEIASTEKKVSRQPVGAVLAEEEVLAMLEAASHPRDKALVFVHYEGMTRIGDCWAYKWKDFEFRRSVQGKIESAVVTLPAETKTGSRRIVLVESVPDLLKWKAAHPEADNPEAFVWRNMASNSDGSPMTYQRTWAMLKRLAAKAGVKTKTHPNIFRRTRCTHLLRRGVPQEVVRRQGGWAEGSKAFYRYVKIVEKDIEDSFRRLAGLDAQEATDNPFRVRKCQRCGAIGSCLDLNCPDCKFPLSEEVIRQLDEKRSDELRELRAQMDRMWGLLELAASRRDGELNLASRRKLLAKVARRRGRRDTENRVIKL